jgi:hypothetical protein
MKTIKKGSRGYDVKVLQRVLKIPDDGAFGNQTKQTLIEYQKSNGLTPDGICGNKTWAFILARNGVVKHKTATIIKDPPEKIGIVVSNKKFKQTASEFITNGTFFWNGETNGILIDGKVYWGSSSHAWRGFPQSVLYFDGQNVGVKRVRYAAELGNVKWAIGGCGMITPYGYSPVSEGFSGKYSDILNTRDKTVIGYKNGEIYRLVIPSISHGRLLTLLKEIGLEIAISLDGGGSTCMRTFEDIMKSDGRTINNWVVRKQWK